MKIKKVPISTIISELFDTKILGVDENFRIVRNSRLVLAKGRKQVRVEITPRVIDRPYNASRLEVLHVFLPRRRILTHFSSCDVIGAIFLGRYLDRKKSEVWGHKDGNNLNNHPDNLKIMTVSEIHKGYKASPETRAKMAVARRAYCKKYEMTKLKEK